MDGFQSGQTPNQVRSDLVWTEPHIASYSPLCNLCLKYLNQFV